MFSSVILQCDKMVKKARDICHVMERRLEMWHYGRFNTLVQEAMSPSNVTVVHQTMTT